MARLFQATVQIGKALNVKTAQRLARESFKTRGRRAMGGVQGLMFNAVRAASPVVSGATKASWKKSPIIVTATEIKSNVFSEALGAIVLEKGAKRHSPPPNALDMWIQSVKGAEISTERELRDIAFKIRRKFQVSGKRATKIFENAVKAIRDKARIIVQRNLVKLTVDLVKGK